jgi:benzoyl-CoA reductase/2-hydroxyglutaryl-CoA dehydratase subunit BcrC/BadD/HgdB
MALKEFHSQLEYIKHSRDNIHSYSRGVRKLFDLAIAYVYDAERAYLEGKKAVWTSSTWEAPLFYAVDTIPVSYTELGRLGNQEAITISEDYYQLPREACSMVKATLGEWYLRKESGIKRIVGSGGACEPYFVASELIKKDGYEVYNMENVYRPPDCNQERYNQILNFLMDEICDLARWLSNRELDEEKLREEIKRRNQFLRKIRRIMELRIENPFYIRSLPTMFLLMGSGHYFGKPDEFGEMLDMLLAELTDPKLPIAVTQKPVPLVWSGGRGQEFGVYQSIDDAGGAILGWVIPTPYARDYREDVPPLEALARYRLDGQMAGATIFRRGFVEEQIKKSKAQGIVLYGYVGCSSNSIRREMERKYFQKQGIPSINLEGSFQVGPPSGQLLTRVRAFIEMLAR